MTTAWNEAQKWEAEWHGTCQNSYGEETKQLVYAERIGLKLYSDAYSGFNFDGGNKTFLDVGGGPYSLLLKFRNLKRGVVADPCLYPAWVYQRYQAAGIETWNVPGEKLDLTDFDEVLMYNVLQHTQEPELVVRNALRAGKILRVFEWLDTDLNVGHLHVLTQNNLDRWLGGIGKVETINDRGCCGKCYAGVFKGAGYEEQE